MREKMKDKLKISDVVVMLTISLLLMIVIFKLDKPKEVEKNIECLEMIEYFLDHEEEINFGVEHAVRILQRSLNFEDYKNEQLEVDGILGNKTIQKYRNYTNSIKTERE